MKKILLYATAILLSANLFAGECQDGPYGIQVNGGTVYDAVALGEADHQGRAQYLAHVPLNAGDVCMLINKSCNATWMVDIDPYGEFEKFEGGKETNKLTCNTAGCYDFYIKMKSNDDLLYIGAGSDCGGSEEPIDPYDPPTPSENSYGMLKNGTTYYAGTLNTGALDKSFEEYQVIGVPLAAGDKLKLRNASNGDTWAVTLDGASTTAITLSNDEYVCNEAGCYDFYIKLKFGEDNLYIGKGSEGCTEWGQAISGGGEDPIIPTGDGAFYLVGYINGADHGDNESWNQPSDYKFVDGKLSATFTEISYVYLKKSVDANWIGYMIETYIEPAANATGTFKLSGETVAEKMGVPANVQVNFTLAENADGTVTLSYTTGESPIDPIDPPTPPTGTITVFFHNIDGWADVYAHAWEHEGPTLTEWPGQQMTAVVGQEGWFQTSFAANANRIIFNCGLGCEQQTADLEIDPQNLYRDGENWTNSFGTTALKSIEMSQIFANNGRIFGADNARIFTISGLDVTSMNGQLNGIYIVRQGENTYKIAVK